MLLWVHATGKSRVKIKDRLYNWQSGEWPHFVPLHDSRELVRSSFSAGAEAATTKSLSLHGQCLQYCLPQPCPPSQAAELMQQTCTRGDAVWDVGGQGTASSERTDQNRL